jgi:hypothetical protein
MLHFFAAILHGQSDFADQFTKSRFISQAIETGLIHFTRRHRSLNERDSILGTIQQVSSK